MSDNDRSDNSSDDVRQFDALIGTWTTEATHPDIEGVVPGSVTFEWLAGGRFVVQRSHHESTVVPDSIAVLGPPEDGDGLVMEYFDSRGVRRTYRTSLVDGVWSWWRNATGFEQRFSATLAPDRFDGYGHLARTPGDWREDLNVSYRRTA
jgi:hypothetical protein